MAFPAIPLILSALVAGLASAATTIAGRALIGLGIGIIAYKGIGAMLELVLSQIKGLFSGLPPEMCAISSMLQVDVCITILFSAYTARLMLNGLTNGTIKKWGIK